MNRMILSLTLLLTAPAFGQIYKCPQPDGKISYQAARCAAGSRLPIQDNGRGGGEIRQEPAARQAPDSSESSGLREGEQRMLEQVQQQEKETKDRAAEFAKAEAIRDHQKAVEAMSVQMHQDANRRLELMRKGYRN